MIAGIYRTGKPMATVTVRYFASLREKIGRSEQLIEIKGEESVAALFVRATGLPLPSNTLVAINQEYADTERCPRSGDEVAFFPPVTGG